MKIKQIVEYRRFSKQLKIFEILYIQKPSVSAQHVCIDESI